MVKDKRQLNIWIAIIVNLDIIKMCKYCKMDFAYKNKPIVSIVIE